MASLATSPAFFSSPLLPSVSDASLGPCQPVFRPGRAQAFPFVHLSAHPNHALGFRRRRRGVPGSKGKDEYEDLENQVYEFMEASDKPEVFPTRKELMAAGRADLAMAIDSLGGWLAYGWGCEDEGEKWGEGDERVPASGGSRKDGDEEGDATASSSGRLMEMEDGKGGGVEGILFRLEKERSVAFGLEPREKEVNGRAPKRSVESDPGYAGSESRSYAMSGYQQNAYYDVGDAHPRSRFHMDVNNENDSWPLWNLRRSGSSLSNFEAAEIVPDCGKNSDRNLIDDVPVGKNSDRNLIDDVPVDDQMGSSITTNFNGRIGSHSDGKHSLQNEIRVRLQRLESELTCTLELLRSRNNGITSDKVEEESCDELHRLCDAFEFQETEIMNSQNKLRSIRAKLAVLEGKMALETIETQKTKEDKQRRLDAAQKCLQLLHTTCIVWSSSASEVFLMGSFDGWTSQRKMEKSSAGVHYLYLKLYPGRYEIKFIVDGAWKVDPLRPIVHNNGYENNLLIVT